MKKILLLNKKQGETPLEAINRFRKSNPLYKETKMTYAGRLDPMASGLLLVLAGDEKKNKEKYLRLDKEYKFEVLFGFATDTYDILGLVSGSKPTQLSAPELKKKISGNLKHFRGKIIQKYPLYSSRTVKGKPLFSYGRQGIDVEIPEREIVIKKITLETMRQVGGRKLFSDIEKRIRKVKGDFRQEKILKAWKEELAGKEKEKFPVAAFTVKCGSGTYVRSIADSLGERLGIPALAFSIKRTKIGKFGKV